MRGDEFARIWWKTGAISPLVRGLTGQKAETHLVLPVRFKNAHGVTGINVVVHGLEFRVIHPSRISPVERQDYLDYLRKSAQQGSKLAIKLGSSI